MDVNQEQGRRVAVIIDDEPDIRSLVETVLIQSGFETVTASNGKDGIELVRRHQPTITTLDVNMPGMDGFTVARMIREVSSTYVIMLTGLDGEIDVVEGLGAGADDYLVKPFRPRELRARVERVMARQGNGVAPVAAVPPVAASPEPVAAAPTLVMETVAAAAVAEAVAQAVAQPVAQTLAQPMVVPAPVVEVVAQPVAAATASTLLHDGLELDEATRVSRVDGRALELTRSEFELMAALMRSGRRVRSKADLVLTLRGESYVTDYYVTDADKRAIEVHMANLRRKIGDSSSTPRWIETVRGVGYRLTSD